MSVQDDPRLRPGECFAELLDVRGVGGLIVSGDGDGFLAQLLDEGLDC